MQNCGCYDPGFILKLLLGAQEGRVVNAWLQDAIQKMGTLPVVHPLTEKDIVWMGTGSPPNGLLKWITCSPDSDLGGCGMTNLLLDAGDAQGYRQMLEQFLTDLKRPVRLYNLVFIKPASDAAEAHVHLTIRLLRAILLKVQSGTLLLPENINSGMDKSSFWGNTLNEAHLVYNEEMPQMILKSLARADATELNQWAAQLKLPGTNVAYFNYIPAELFTQPGWYYAALAVSMAMSGLSGLGGLTPAVDYSGVSGLLQARGVSAVFHPSSAQMVIDLVEPIFALLKISPDALMMSLCLVNLSPEKVLVKPDMAALGLPEGGWTDLIGGQPKAILKGQGIHMDGYSALWLCQPV